MSITTRVVLVLMMLVLAVSVSAQTPAAQTVGGEQSIPNPGFEGADPGIFTEGAFGGTLSPDTTQARSGSYSLRHFSEEPNSYTRPWKGSHPVPLGDTAETLRFSAWVKADAPGTRIRMYMFCLDAEYRTSREYWSASYYKTGHTWKKVSHTHTCPAGSSYASVRLDNRDAGRTVWWDDLDLVRVANLVPDPGFESGELRAPFAGARRGSVVLDPDRARKGFYSLRHTAEAQDSFTFPFRDEPAAILAAASEPRAYTFSAWATADVDVPVQLSIFCLDEDLDSRALGGSQGQFVAGERWRKLEHSHTCPVETRYVSVRLDNDGDSGSTVWWDDLILEANGELEVLSVGPGYRLLDPASNTRSSENTRLWEVNRAGIESLPVTRAQKDWLHAAFADDPGGSPDEVIYVSQELLEAVVRPDFPVGYERFRDPGDPDAARFSLCRWSEEERDRAWPIQENLYDRQFPFGGPLIGGQLSLSLPLTGQVQLSVTYKIRKCLGIPLGFKFVSASAEGEVTMAGDGDLEVRANSGERHFEREWELANPRLGTVTFFIGPVPVVLVFDLPIHAGISLDAAIAAELTAALDASATGTFSYTCTPRECTGRSDFSDDFEFTGPHASIEIDLKARAHARVMLRVSLWNAAFAYVEGGARPYAKARLWGYYGNTCGDADGDGRNETVRALAADLSWGYTFVYGIGGGFLPDRVRDVGGREYLLGWRDLLGSDGSTALKPMLLGPSTVAEREPVTYTVSMRPCYPYADAVHFTVDPGDWAGDTLIPSPPSGSATVSRQFVGAGEKVVVVRAREDAFGRKLGTSFRRVLNVTPGGPAAPSALSAGAVSSSSVRLSWRDHSNDETGFEVERAPSLSGAFVPIATTPANQPSYVDDTLQAGSSYRYRVRAVKNGIPSGYTNLARVTALAAPAAPTGLAAAYNSESRVRLSWTDRSSDEEGFQVQFSYSGSAWGNLSPSTVGANVTTYTTGATPPTGSYQFRVRSFRDDAYSGWSNVASLLVGAPPPPPTASIAWIQPAESAWGPAGTLTAAGHAANGTGGVQLVFRERSSTGTWGPWITVAWRPEPSANTTWSNTISSGSPTDTCHWFDAYVSYSGVTSPVFHYTGAPGCP